MGDAIRPHLFDAADGTAALPSYTFLNDRDTGFYRAASDQLGVTLGGAAKLLYSAGAFAFQEATIISTTAGDLTLNPAGVIVASRDISLGAVKLTTTNLSLKERDANHWVIGDAGFTVLRGLEAHWETENSDNANVLAKARDNGVGIVEISRLQGAADPYIRIGRDDTGVALNAVTDMLVLQAGGGSGNEAAGQGFGLSVKLGNAASQVEERGSLDWVLVTATDGAEDSRLDFNLMAGGAMNLAAQLSGAGILDVDLSSGLGTATVGLFDDYDDAIVLRQGISERKLDVLEKIGVIRRKNTGSGWMLNVQAMLYLLAGGVYQNRQMMDERLAQLEHRLVLKGV